jgi:hypothetical protein
MESSCLSFGGLSLTYVPDGILPRRGKRLESVSAREG